MLIPNHNPALKFVEVVEEGDLELFDIAAFYGEESRSMAGNVYPIPVHRSIDFGIDQLIVFNTETNIWSILDEFTGRGLSTLRSYLDNLDDDS